MLPPKKDDGRSVEGVYLRVIRGDEERLAPTAEQGVFEAGESRQLSLFREGTGQEDGAVRTEDDHFRSGGGERDDLPPTSRETSRAVEPARYGLRAKVTKPSPSKVQPVR